jgi:hypothetical protein
MLLAVSDVGAEAVSVDYTTETGGIVNGGAKKIYNNHSACYDSLKQGSPLNFNFVAH